MARVDQAEAVKFIKTNIKRAPERQETREGQYDYMLIRSALDLKKNFKHTNSTWCAAYEETYAANAHIQHWTVKFKIFATKNAKKSRNIFVYAGILSYSTFFQFS